ncbi:MarC family protein [Alphaproteobacteria bacterium LSUCC0684]
MLDQWTQTFLLAMVVIDPISLAPIFLAMVSPYGKAAIDRIIIVATIVAIGVLGSFYLFGGPFLEKIGVEVASFRILGGIFLLAVAFEMVFERRTSRKISTAEQVASKAELDSLAVFPLAIPLIAGPAALTLTVVTAQSEAFGSAGHLMGFLPIAAVVVLAAVAMKAAAFATRILTPVVTLVIQRLFGMILGALATQFVIDGIKEIFF